MKHSILTFLLLLQVACTSKQLPISTANYAKNKFYSQNDPGNRLYSQVGEVSAKASGPFSSNCSDLIRDSAKALTEEAKALGADAVVEVRWKSASDLGYSKNPTCIAQVGWFYGIYTAFVPFISNSYRSATVYGMSVKLETAEAIKQPSNQPTINIQINNTNNNTNNDAE